MQKGVDFIGVAVVYYCHDGKGNFVMAHRNQNSRDEQGRWDIGGGGVEFGLSVEENLRKEIKEEYGCEVLDYEFLGFRDVHREHAGRKTHWIALDFRVLIDKTQVKNNEPHKFTAVKWFTLENLPETQKLHSQLPHFLEKYKSRL